MINDIKLTDIEKDIKRTRLMIRNRLIDNKLSKRVVRSIFDDIDTLIAFSVVYAFERQQAIVDKELIRNKLIVLAKHRTDVVALMKEVRHVSKTVPQSVSQKEKDMGTFKFELGQKVEIECSKEQGIVIGRAECQSTENQYFLRYKTVGGRAVEDWWLESALQAVPENTIHKPPTTECRYSISADTNPNGQ